MRFIAISVFFACLITACGEEETQDDLVGFGGADNAPSDTEQTPSDTQMPSGQENSQTPSEQPTNDGNCPEVSPTLVPAQLPAAVTNIFYEADMNANGLDQESIRWSISAGALPAGITLNALTGTISGMSSATGISNFEVTIEPRDLTAECPAPSASIQYRLNVASEADESVANPTDVAMDEPGKDTNNSNMNDDAECQVAADCPAAVVPRCSATCDAGVCGTRCDVAVPAEGPACPADPAAADYCATACSFFALCGVDQCAPLQEDSYIPLYEGCIEDQCGQAGLICLQQECGLLVSLAKGVSQRFSDVCDNGYQGD